MSRRLSLVVLSLLSLLAVTSAQTCTPACSSSEVCLLDTNMQFDIQQQGLGIKYKCTPKSSVNYQSTSVSSDGSGNVRITTEGGSGAASNVPALLATAGLIAALRLL